MTDKLRFPIGTFTKPENITNDNLQQRILDIETFPSRLKSAIKNTKNSDLSRQYRPKGWTIRQVINHCADSHMNSLMRFKLALTEDNPTIKPYMEAHWAELADSLADNIEPAISMLEGIHCRWVILLRSLSTEQLKRTFIHPEHGNKVSLEENIGIYAWHCNHHLAHVKLALE